MQKTIKTWKTLGVIGMRGQACDDAGDDEISAPQRLSTLPSARMLSPSMLFMLALEAPEWAVTRSASYRFSAGK